ncbi:hypothetical protein CLOSYM_04583 [[Clostridium] symbiosum ATCC 14940]|uniref:Uncharacterized protein n=1 Tax=[Clostridium] symbiosum ATCC 14940 TaxID=411472 RepID=A0ABC9TRD6_CLOSY|nr:hypothetical protein CLOSYM_04583 [[Clostridium] symbiosum ATCC 14940]
MLPFSLRQNGCKLCAETVKTAVDCSEKIQKETLMMSLLLSVLCPEPYRPPHL